MTATAQGSARLRIRAAGDTHIGSRQYNEDIVLVRRDLSLFLLADGAGGDNAGAMASSLATKAIAQHFEETMEEAATAPVFDDLGLSTAARRLSAAVHCANREIVDLAHASGRYKGMGTTIVACFVESDRGVIHIAHVGDSRCYRMRAGRLELLTRDHSLMTDVLELVPELDEESAADLPRAVVTRALGMEKTVRVNVQSWEAAPLDRFLLCSDGLSDELDEDQIAEALRQDNDPEANARLLLDIANAAGAADNVAVVLVDITQASGARQTGPVLVRPRLQKRSTRRPPAESPDPEVIVADLSSEERSILEALAEQGDDQPDNTQPDEGELVKMAGEEKIPEAILELDYDDQDFLQPTSSFTQREAREGDTTVRFRRSCAKCGSAFDGAQDACPNCWQF